MIIVGHDTTVFSFCVGCPGCTGDCTVFDASGLGKVPAGRYLLGVCTVCLSMFNCNQIDQQVKELNHFSQVEVVCTHVQPEELQARLAPGFCRPAKQLLLKMLKKSIGGICPTVPCSQSRHLTLQSRSPGTIPKCKGHPYHPSELLPLLSE